MQKLQSMIFGNHYNPFACSLVATSTRWTFIDNAYLKYITNPMPTLNVKHTISLDITSTSQVLTIDNIANTYSETPTSVASNIMIFARNTNRAFGTNGNNAYMKLYYFKIYLNNILVRDYYPVLDNNGVACLFDATTNTFAYNQGVGDFFCYETGLIFDRVKADVTNATLKGQYNPSDLNRVERWCRKLADELTEAGYPINITTKNDWYVTDLRDYTNMERIRNNIRKIMNGYHYITKIYNTVNGFDYRFANNWEKILNEIYYMFYGMENWQVHSGVANSGQNRMWQNRYRTTIKQDAMPQYIPIEFIESNGTQYIDTGIKPNANIHCVVDFQLTDIPTQSQGIIGGWQASKGMLFGVRYANNVSNFQFAFGTSAWAGNTITADLERHTLYMNDSNGDARLDNTVLASHSNVVSLTNTTYNIWLMKINGGVSYSCSAKIYSCQMYDNNTLIRDFVPALDMNLRPCLYDKVTNTYFYNQGTGEFYAGKGRICNYIESTSTQYIDTGFKHNNNTRMVADIDFIGGVRYSSPFGSWGSTNDNRVALFGSEISNSALTNLGVYYANVQAWAVASSVWTGRKIWDFNKNVFKIGTSNHTYTAQTFQSLYNDIIFGKSSYGGTIRTTTDLSNMKLYSFKIYDNGTLVRDFVPVLNASLVPCLYDKKNNQYYTNAGTGTFLYG